MQSIRGVAISLLPTLIPACMDTSCPSLCSSASSSSIPSPSSCSSQCPCPDPCSNSTPTTSPAKRKRNKRKTHDFPDRDEFKFIEYLNDSEAARLNKLRDDLQESIERTVRIEQAFVKQLTKHAVKSDRVKSIIKAIEEIPFHCDLQRKIVSVSISHILKSKVELTEKLRREKEALDKERQRLQEIRNNCYTCNFC